MATQTRDSSGTSSGSSGPGRGTPMSSYIGFGIIVLMVLAMIALQTFSSS
jgi:hypothetical protein